MFVKIFLIHNKISSLDPIRPYVNQTIKIELPGDKTIFNINWFSLFDLHTNEAFGSIFMPEVLNVPPSLNKILVCHKFFFLIIINFNQKFLYSQVPIHFLTVVNFISIIVFHGKFLVHKLHCN